MKASNNEHLQVDVVRFIITLQYISAIKNRMGVFIDRYIYIKTIAHKDMRGVKSVIARFQN